MNQSIKNYLLRHLLNSIVPNDVITIEKGVIKLDKRPLTDDELRQLQAEIKALEGFRIWGIITESLRYLANDKIQNKSVNFEDVTYGKAMLYNLSVQKDIINIVKNKK